MRRTREASPLLLGRSGFDDSGFSLVEMLVAMVTTVVITAAFLLTFFEFSTSASDTTSLSQQQGQVRNDMRVLESDVRSADPLLLVPSSFTSDPGAVTSTGTYGTSSTDVIAMYSTDDRYSACRSGPTPLQPVSPLSSTPSTANLIWAYSPTAHTLTRYSYCSGTWTPGIVLLNVVSPSGSTFTVQQTSPTTPTTTLLTRTPIPNPTTVANQSTPVCGVALMIYLSVATPQETTPFTTNVVVALPNEASFSSEGCN